MNRRIVFFLLLFLFFVFLFSSCTFHEVISDIPFLELGIPSEELYTTGIRARSPWDMIVWDGTLYVGVGDFDANSGPVPIYKLDLQTDEWSSSELLPEEEFNRFCVLGDRLTAPGIDPRQGWELGNYYVLCDCEWAQKRVLPNGVHAFDMVEYDGKIFAGLGVPDTESAVVVSSDGGETFSPVEMQKDGVKVDTSGLDTVRVYDLFVLRGNLYASFLYGNGSPYAYELYRYEDGVFVFDNDWSGKVNRRGISYRLISEKIEYNDRLYIANGYLYVTSDMDQMTRIEFPYAETTFDLALDNGRLYVLNARKLSDGEILVSVWKKSGSGETTFTQLFNFVYPVAPTSLAVKDGVFYIGMASTFEEHELNGMILKIVYP